MATSNKTFDDVNEDNTDLKARLAEEGIILGNNGIEQKKIFQSTSLQTDSASSYQVGLNIFEELSYKYNKELKQQLKSKQLTFSYLI